MDEPRRSAPLLDRARLLSDLVPGAVVCRQSAAHVWGLNALSFGSTEEEWPVELITPEPMEIPGCVTHLIDLPGGDVAVFRGLRLTTPERTALDCARWLPRVDAVAVLDQFLRRGVDHQALLKRATGFWRLRDTLSLGDPGAASPRESWLRVVLVDACLPRPATQIRVQLGDDRVAYLDLGWEEHKLAVEYDGVDHHSSPADRHRDERRRAELAALGWRVLVVRRDIIPARTAQLIEHVANALIECGWHPGSERMTQILARIRAARRRPR